MMLKIKFEKPLFISAMDPNKDLVDSVYPFVDNSSKTLYVVVLFQPAVWAWTEPYLYDYSSSFINAGDRKENMFNPDVGYDKALCNLYVSSKLIYHTM